jgi:hypothetical protein
VQFDAEATICGDIRPNASNTWYFAPSNRGRDERILRLHLLSHPQDPRIALVEEELR